MNFARADEPVLPDFTSFCLKMGSQNARVRPELGPDKCSTCHGPRPMDSNSSMGVLGRGQGAIADLWGCCVHTFHRSENVANLSKRPKNPDTPETIHSGGGTFVWKVAPGGAKKSLLEKMY